ncbi:hypothetical protein OROHE_025893 [Orobanche hederae]
MEESPQIRRFHEVLTAEKFTSEIESKNVPAAFSGCVKDWKAFSKWNASSGGLNYLQELVGSLVVGAMLSSSAPVFYGDIRSHERIPIPFSNFLGYCKDLLQCGNGVQDSIYSSRKHEAVGHSTQHGDHVTGEESPQQIYLAQVVPIMNAENEEKAQLERLREDIETPAFLKGKVLASINLWMNNARTRSSTHYDPHHNLLCVVSGCKQVVLWPPSACPILYPLPLYGESSNHSAIPLENTNFSLYPRAKLLDEYSQKVILHAGDAVFIPEGWFHQVDSEDLTIAVNFWWGSDMMSNMSEHMDAYYLRRILKRTGSYACYGQFDQDFDLNHQTANVKGNEQEFLLHELKPFALKSLHELVSLVHHRINQNQPVNNTSADQSISRMGEDDNVEKIIKTNKINLEEDAIANIVWNLEPCAFQSVFLAMAHNFPRTLEAFIMHALSPVGAEVLTRKFEQMDQIIAEDDRSRFYQKFYSVFDNQFLAMDTLLNGKESFARQAFNNVLIHYLGNNLDSPKTSREYDSTTNY